MNDQTEQGTYFCSAGELWPYYAVSRTPVVGHDPVEVPVDVAEAYIEAERVFAEARDALMEVLDRRQA